MKPIECTIVLSLDEIIDEAIYGGLYAFSRFDAKDPWSTKPWAQVEKDGEWIPVRDWKMGRYEMSPEAIRRLARHCIEIGKQMKKD